MRIATLIGLLLTASCCLRAPTYDVVIYGGTSAALSAAITGARLGLEVIVVSPDKHIGGMTTQGLGWTDSGRKEVIGGVAREFYARIKEHYDNPEAWTRESAESFAGFNPMADAMWVFEPHVAEATFEAMLQEEGVPVHRDRWLNREQGVELDGTKIVSIATLGGRTYRGRMFIDATFEGDLMASAGVTYVVGREGNTVYGETLNGVQTRRAISHQFELDINPYVIPGDSSSGLLPGVHGGLPGEEGSGDERVQAYNFRMCLTDAPENRVPFPKPDNYDPMQYELLGRYLDAGWRGVFRKFDPIPNRKTDTNNHGAFSTDYIGMNYAYPEASYAERRAIVAQHEAYQKGLMWFLANDPRVPEDVRTEMRQWGLARDEFMDNDHWPHQVYVREARRMVGDMVVTERHLRRHDPTLRPIGMGSYNMDSHNVQRYVDASGFARNEGDIQINPGAPYPIDYGAILPRQEEATNLLVPVAVSSTHIAYGSIRMEPVFMILGQSAMVAAALALEADQPVQDVDYVVLRERLLDAGQVLAREDGWTQLFNGRDLSGWQPKLTGHVLGDNYQATYRVEDSLLKVRYDGYEGFAGRFGHLFHEQQFSHYRLGIEYRFVGDQVEDHPGAWAWRNSGIMFHGQPAETMGLNQDFPISLEAQLLGAEDAGERTTMNLCTPGTHVVMSDTLVTQHCISSRSATMRDDRWVRADLLVLGDSLVRHFVEGEQVLEYSWPIVGGGVVNGFDPAMKEDGLPLKAGTISLQSESHPMDIRKVEILNLAGCMDRSSPSFRGWYLASEPDACH